MKPSDSRRPYGAFSDASQTTVSGDTSNFPREHLAARFADDPDEHKRWLIYNDPTAPADVVLKVSHAPNVNVRRSIAGHANLPPDG